MGWLIALAVLILIGFLPVGVRIRYNSEGARVLLILGPVKITLVPAKKKEKKPKKEKKKAQAPKEESLPTDPPPAPREKKKESGGPVTDFLPLVKVALDFLGGFARKLRIDNLQLKLIMAGGDPCDLGINYGRAWAAVGNLMPRLERVFVIRKRDIEVECDFWAPSTTVIASADITITIGRILSLVCVLAFRGIREYLKINKKRKGGAAK